jgi:hypothetical protein
MALDSLLAFVLVLQGLMGGVDTLLNHEYLEQLPKRPEARREVGLHAIREAIYAVLFAGLGWFAWHGAAAYLIAGLVLAEIGVTTVDEWTENRIRVLPQNERVLHIFLTLNMGIIVAILVPTLAKWIDQPDELVPADHGWMSWALLALAAAAAEWSVLDFLAWRRLGSGRAAFFQLDTQSHQPRDALL